MFGLKATMRIREWVLDVVQSPSQAKPLG